MGSASIWVRATGCASESISVRPDTMCIGVADWARSASNLPPSASMTVPTRVWARSASALPPSASITVPTWACATVSWAVLPPEAPGGVLPPLPPLPLPPRAASTSLPTSRCAFQPS